EDGIRDFHVTGVQTCALPIFTAIPDPRLCPDVQWRYQWHQRLVLVCNGGDFRRITFLPVRSLPPFPCSYASPTLLTGRAKQGNHGTEPARNHAKGPGLERAQCRHALA